MLPTGNTEFVTSCAQSMSRHDPGAPAPVNSASNVPNATEVATIFVISQYPVTLSVNTSDEVQKPTVLSDGMHLISMLTNGSCICEVPLQLVLGNGDFKNEVTIWWTITETVTVDFYNRLPIFLAPGRTHSIIVNTTRFPLSNMLITETTISNRNGAADIARIYVNKNRLATPYAHLHGCPKSNFTTQRAGEPVTQYVVVIPPELYAAATHSVNDRPPSPASSSDAHLGMEMSGLSELEHFAMESWQTSFLNFEEAEKTGVAPSELPPQPSFHHGRPFFFIWIENTSNFTLNYTIRVTQSIQDHLDLVSGPVAYSSPYLFTAFFNFSKDDVLEAMKKVGTADDSPDMIEMIFDLTTFQETFVSRRPVMYLGVGFYPTRLHFTAREQAITTDDPNKPLLELFMRFHHRFNVTSLPNGTIFYVRLDGVSYSQKGFLFQPMIIRPKPIPLELPFSTNFTAVTQEWIVFNYDHTVIPSKKNDESSLVLRGDSGFEAINWAMERFFFGSQKQQQQYLRVLYSVDSGMNPQIQAFESSGWFPTELKHDRKFTKENGNWLILCYELDLTKRISVSLWNPKAFLYHMDVFFSFRVTDACMVEMTPTKPIAKSALVILVTLGSILALLLILFAFYLCARPTKTEFLTASEEEAAKIRAMSRSHADVLNAEAADYDKVPFLVRDSSGYYQPSSDFLRSGGRITRGGINEENDDTESDHDGLVGRRYTSSSSFASAAFGNNEFPSISDEEDNTIGSDSEYY